MKREAILKSQVEDLRSEILQLENSYQKREETYIIESKNHCEQIEKYQRMITDNKIKAIQKIDVDHFSMSKKLKKEIENLRKQIKLKDEIINELKNIENSEKRKDRKDIRKILNKFKEVIDSCEDQMKNYVKEQPRIDQLLLDLNTKHNKTEHELIEYLTEAKEELYNTKEQLRVLAEQDQQEIITDLDHKLIVANNELDHAKRNLIQYINSLNELEDVIKDSQLSSIGENEEVQRLRLENERLNEENSSLIESKRDMDCHYQGEVDRLKEETQTQKAEIINMSREYDKLSLKISTVYKNLEIWRDREQTIRDNYDRMEKKLKTALTLKKKSKDFVKSEGIIRDEEDLALREEHKKMEKLLKLSHDKWDEEKATINEEIFNLRSRLAHCEEYFQEI